MNYPDNHNAAVHQPHHELLKVVDRKIRAVPLWKYRCGPESEQLVTSRKHVPNTQTVSELKSRRFGYSNTLNTTAASQRFLQTGF